MRMIIMLMVITALSVGCGNEDVKKEALKSPDVKELVHAYTVGDEQAATASITSSELIVTEENKEVKTYNLPEDEFFVSIAPFVNTTHPCDIHSLTGCQGELVEEDFNVHIEDSEGNVVLNEKKKSETNGFIDLWLPRNDTFTVTIKQDDKETTSEITTFDGDNTCITTMQLG